MDKKIQAFLDKYEPKPLNSIHMENKILEIEKDIIFEKESQIPNLVINSNCPFDKNYCFYDISLTVSTKENIFPKEKYFLKSQQIVELKPVDINEIFNDDIMFQNVAQPSPEGKKENEKVEDEDEDSVHKKIISSIETHHYKSYIPKNLEKNNNIIINKSDNEWYIIGNNIKEGPFNDFAMYNKLYKIYYESISKKEKMPNYLINEKKADIFMTMDDCFKRLKTKYEYNSQNNANNQLFNKLMLQYMNNMLIYRTQMMKYYQMNNIASMNSINNQNANKSTVPNKFDNSQNNANISNIANNKLNNKKKNDNRNINNKYNNTNNRWNNSNNYNFNNRGKNQFNQFNNNNRFHKNNNYHQNKYYKKEKRIKDDDYKEKKENNYTQNKNGNGKELEDKKNEALNKKEELHRENNMSEDNKEEQNIIKVEDVGKWFENE